jgi:hypothetical protein
MRAKEFLTDAVSNRRVIQYIKQHHPTGEWSASANNMVLQYPKYELAWVSVDQLKIDSDEPVDDPYGRVIDVDQSYASRLSSQDIEDNPIVIDTQGHILDGNHRAWQAKQLGMDMIPAYQPVKELAESAERGVIYTKPDFAREWGEAARYPEFQQLGREAWINIAAQGRVVDWSSLDSVGNVELDLASLDQSKVRSVAVDVKRNQVELPIVGQWVDGTLDLIAGNTRIATLLAQGHNPKVWLVDVPGDLNEST